MRVCAVSYLNTVPLVWGMLHGAQRGLFDLSFAIPSECADRLAGGEADIGIVPAIELSRQGLEVIPGTGIACRGIVRSILAISKKPFAEIATLAADSSSRTSVALARILLADHFGVQPVFIPMKPDLPSMLESADAALIIGDPALQLDPATLPYHVADLGDLWTQTTGLPMVFAVWAGRPGCITDGVAGAFLESCRFGQAHLEEIAAAEGPARGISRALALEYLSANVIFELGDREYEGLELFLTSARRFESDLLVGQGQASGSRGLAG